MSNNQTYNLKKKERQKERKNNFFFLKSQELQRENVRKLYFTLCILLCLRTIFGVVCFTEFPKIACNPKAVTPVYKAYAFWWYDS